MRLRRPIHEPVEVRSGLAGGECLHDGLSDGLERTILGRCGRGRWGDLAGSAVNKLQGWVMLGDRITATGAVVTCRVKEPSGPSCGR